MEVPSYAHKDLFFKEFNNPIDQNCINKVAEDEDACGMVANCIRLGRFVTISPEKIPENFEIVEPVPERKSLILVLMK